MRATLCGKQPDSRLCNRIIIKSYQNWLNFPPAQFIAHRQRINAWYCRFSFYLTQQFKCIFRRNSRGSVGDGSANAVQTMRPGTYISKAWLRFRFMKFCGIKCNDLSWLMCRWVLHSSQFCGICSGWDKRMWQGGDRAGGWRYAFRGTCVSLSLRHVMKCGKWGKRPRHLCVLIFCRLALQYFVICKPLWIYLLFSWLCSVKYFRVDCVCLCVRLGLEHPPQTPSPIPSRSVSLCILVCVCLCVSQFLRQHNRAYAWFQFVSQYVSF